MEPTKLEFGRLADWKRMDFIKLILYLADSYYFTETMHSSPIKLGGILESSFIVRQTLNGRSLT
jgi:hypothetical protein